MTEENFKEKIELLQKVSLFSKLKGRELEVIARYSRYMKFAGEQIIFKEGSPSRELYVVMKGEVLIMKNQDGEDLHLARFIPGECFGELDLLDNAPRSATAGAEKDTVLLTFPMKGVLFRDVIQKHPEIFARILHKLLATIAGRIRSTNKLISEKTPWIHELRRQLLIDKLTGLYNRTFLEEDFSTLLPEYGESTSLIMIKPDNFKEINDRFSHEAGDRVLKLMAEKVKSILRECDVTIRYRGDEFACVLPGADTKTAVKIAADLRAEIRQMDISDITKGLSFNITVSIGVSTYPIHANDNIKLTTMAFEKMFEARNSGGNRVLCALKT